jgi:hypothetical protein
MFPMMKSNQSTPDEDTLVVPFDLVETTDEAGWFASGRARALRPSERPKSVPPTGDDDIDRWLR